MGGIIDHDEIGSRGLFGHGHLRRKSRLCLYTRIPACAHHAMNLTFQWGCDCEYYIIIALPVRLKKERDDGDGKGGGGGRGRGGGGRAAEDVRPYQWNVISKGFHIDCWNVISKGFHVNRWNVISKGFHVNRWNVISPRRRIDRWNTIMACFGRW